MAQGWSKIAVNRKAGQTSPTFLPFLFSYSYEQVIKMNCTRPCSRTSITAFGCSWNCCSTLSSDHFFLSLRHTWFHGLPLNHSWNIQQPVRCIWNSHWWGHLFTTDIPGNFRKQLLRKWDQSRCWKLWWRQIGSIEQQSTANCRSVLRHD